MLELYDKFSKLTLGFIGCNPFYNMCWFSCFYEVPAIQVLKTVNSVIKVFFFSRVLIKAFLGYLYAYHLGLRSNKATWMEIYAMTHFTMACSPVGLISLMDRALRPVVAMVKVRFDCLGCLFNCENHFNFQSYFCYSSRQNNFSNTLVLDPIPSSFEASWLSSISLRTKTKLAF